MKKILILLALISFGVYTCGPSVEGETKAWKKNTESLTQLAKKYPAFASSIDTQIAEAEKLYKEAESISDEDKKAAKLRDANNKLNEGCIGKLQGVESKTSDMRKKIEELRKVRRDLSDTDIRYADIVIRDAESSIDNMNQFLTKATADYSGNPCVEFESSYQNLEIRLDDLDKAITNLERKKSDLEEAESEETTEKTISTSKDDTKKEPVEVECEYCGNMNSADAKECSSCGAPL